MDGLISSFSKWIHEKTSSPLYFTYIGFFIVWNWQIFQIVFFESYKLFGKPRIEYISSNLFFHLNPIVGIPASLTSAIEVILNFSFHTIPPVILTWLAIEYLPKIQKWAFDKHLINTFERKRMFENKRYEHEQWVLNLEKKKDRTLQEIVDVKESQKEKKAVIKKAMTNEEIWEQEFEKLKEHPYFDSLGQVKNIVYGRGGKTREWNINSAQYELMISSDMLAFLNTRELINITGHDKNEVIQLTDKGRFFISRFLESPQR